jgi:orotate phosphoribosyltransferase
MKNVNELITSAGALADSGASHGEIADELNVSRDTASWLVRKSDAGVVPAESDDTEEGRTVDPQDIHVDWSAIGSNTARLSHVGRTVASLLAEVDADADLTVGVEKAGTPLATVVSQALDTGLGSYAPAKHQWNTGDIADLDGSFSRNFSPVGDDACYIVDDIITSGTTMRETIRAVRGAGGTPVACAVLVDKQGVDELDGVPVYSLMTVVRVGDD